MTSKNGEPPKPDWALTGRERKAEKAKTEGRKAPRRRWPWIIVIIVAVAAGGWFARQNGLIGGDTSTEAETPEATQTSAQDTPDEETATAAFDGGSRDVTMQLLTSELTTVSAETLRETVRITGSLAPIRQLGIPAEVAGRVQRVAKSEGQSAVEGETLVQIDLETLRNQLEQSRATADATRAQLEFAQEQLTRTQSLVDRGVSSSSTLDSNEANVRQLRANLAALEKQVSNAERAMEKATIMAPFPGIVSERMVDPGAYVSPGTPLMTLVDISSLELEAVVPVAYAPRIRPGQTVQVSVDGVGDQSFVGTIGRVAPVAVSGTRMLPIFADIENIDGVLRGGMFASGLLVLDEVTEAIGVPAEALREDDDGTYVLKKDGEKAVRQPVTVGRFWDRGRTAQITEGLSDGDTIVSADLPRLQPGMQVSVVEN